jgi:hypothetical protein
MNPGYYFERVAIRGESIADQAAVLFNNQHKKTKKIAKKVLIPWPVGISQPIEGWAIRWVCLR